MDLTRVVSPGMPVYPGTEPPVFSVPCTIESDGFTEKRMTIFSHTGTHMDAPAHIIPGARTLDELDPGHFIGSATLFDLALIGRPVVGPGDLEPFLPQFAGRDFVLLQTGWSRLWGQEGYFRGYPVLSPEAARLLAGLGLKGIGVDAISVDPVETADFPVHRAFLERDTVIVENLAGLEGLPPDGFIFCCFPLRIEKADGSPLRAVALVDAATANPARQRRGGGPWPR